MDKIKVRICSGSRCFMQGGSDLLSYAEFLDEGISSQCEFEVCNCLGECRKAGESDHEPPFAMIGEKVYGDMSPQKLYKVILEQLKC